MPKQATQSSDLYVIKEELDQTNSLQGSNGKLSPTSTNKSVSFAEVKPAN